MSRYLAELVERDVASHTGWPEAYFDNFGQWEGAPLERPEQLPLEERFELKWFIYWIPMPVYSASQR